MSKKTTENSATTQNTNSTITPTNPSWVDSLVKGVGGTVGSLGGMDPTSFVAPANPTLNLAGANAGALTGTPWAYDGSTDLARSVGQANSPDIASLMAKFQNPFQKQVVDATSADLDASDGKVRAQQSLDLARNGAFGGSGAALTQSGTEGELSRARATTLGGLRTTGFQTALGGATSQGQLDQNQMQQRLQAAGQITQNANDFGANQRDNVATQGGIGAVLQQILQAQAGAPLSTAGSLSDILAKLPLNLFHGADTVGSMTGTGNGNSTTTGIDGGDIAKIAAAFVAASDRRLKRDIVKLGERPDGLGVYLFRYLWSPLQHIGVMAQEVLKVKPDAVVTMPNGFMAVNYGML